MAIPTRNEVPEDLKWDLTRIFKTDEDWEAAFDKAKYDVEKLGALKGTLTKSGKDLYEGLTKILAVKRDVENIYVYATMSSDVDTSNSHYLGYVSRVQTLANQFEAVTSFISPEILSIPADKFEQFKKDEPRLKNYAHYLETITNKRPHTLPAEEEKIIADASDAMGVSENTFNVLTNSDMEYGYVQDDEGNMEQLSDGLYSLLIQSQNRDVRKGAFDTLYAAYGQF